jgi:hypothetical protein
MIPVHSQKSYVAKARVPSSNPKEEVWIKVRNTVGGPSHYYLITKREVKPGEFGHEVKMIGQEEFSRFNSLPDSKSSLMEKHQISFLWKGQYFKIDMPGIDESRGFFLRVRRTEAARKLVLPSFIKVMKKLENDGSEFFMKEKVV